MYVVLAQSLTAALSGILVRWQRMHRNGALQAMVRAKAGPQAVKPAQAPVSRPPAHRERWLDSLRAVALARVVLCHSTGWGWLSIAFPSMGVMFALGGSLMVSSLRRTPSVDVIGHRIRRLLPPLWLLGLVPIPLMLVNGWSRATGDHSFGWPQMVFSVFPILDPPGSLWGSDFTVVLWYIRAYLWFILLSPMLLHIFRRRPVLTVLAPLAVVALDTLLGFPLANSGPIGQSVLDFCIFGACWMLGFAHREGMLRRIPPVMLMFLVVTAAGLGAWWTAGHPLPDGIVDLNRCLLAIIGVTLVTGGGLAMATSLGLLPLNPAAPIVPGTELPPAWTLYTVAVVLALLCVRWLAAQLIRKPKTHTWQIEDNPDHGHTELASRMATTPLTADITAYPGIHTAHADLTGTQHAPTLAVVITTEHNADLTDIRHRLDTHGLSRLREALDLESLPTTVEFRFTTKTGTRAL